MFGFLKNLVRRSNSDNSVDAGNHAAITTAEPAPARAPAPAPRRVNQVQQNGKTIELPVQKILEGLPLELQPRVHQPADESLTVSVPLEKILAQLSRGVVKVSFGELRQAVPDLFTSENDRDRVMVALPLAEILERLNPALITRRRVQQQVEVPADIASPFDLHGEGNFFSIGGTNSQPEPAPAPVPQRSVKPAPATPTVRNRGALGSIPPPVPPAASPPTPAARSKPAQTAPQPPAPAPTPPTEPAAIPAAASPAPPIRFNPAAVPKAPPPSPIAPSGPAREPVRKPQPAPTPPPPVAPPQNAPAAAPTQRVVREVQPKQPPVAAPPPSLPAAAPAPRVVRAAPAVQPAAAAPAPRPPAPPPAPTPPAAPAAAKPAPAPAPAPSVPAAKSGPVLPPVVLSLSSLAEGWPDAIRKEILESNLVDAQVALPAESVEQALKQGRIAFSWKSLRSWLKPAVPATTSAHDSSVLELPLKVVAPVFLARQKDKTKPQEKVPVNEEIPNLFFGYPQPDVGAAAVASPRSSDTNFYVWGDTSDTVMVHESEVKRGSTPGTRFVAKYATPNEVVSRALGLQGVAGALVALPDGLMVANQLPPDINGDTLAAFLPQIFGKVSQCTKELRMGDLNNLNFTVGNVPWKIFRVNAIFFAAFGRAGEALPGAQLAALAGELDHKSK